MITDWCYTCDWDSVECPMQKLLDEGRDCPTTKDYCPEYIDAFTGLSHPEGENNEDAKHPIQWELQQELRGLRE